MELAGVEQFSTERTCTRGEERVSEGRSAVGFCLRFRIVSPLPSAVLEPRAELISQREQMGTYHIEAEAPYGVNYSRHRRQRAARERHSQLPSEQGLVHQKR